MLQPSRSWDSVITSGGEKRIIFPCVDLASRPFSIRATQRSQAVEESGLSSISTAFSNPFPPTSLIRVTDFLRFFISSRKMEPSLPTLLPVFHPGPPQGLL